MESPTDSSKNPPPPLAPHIHEPVAKTLPLHQQITATNARNSSMSPKGDAAALTAAPRLLDSDPSKFRSLKRVIVIGRPGSGTDGVSDALKRLGFKVYDFQAASTRYERDFPLWLEAARLRRSGHPYNKSDFDKVIGDHDAIVGAPACFFDADLVKLYPGVKVILVTRDGNSDFMRRYLKKARTPIWRWADPVYSDNLARFVTLTMSVTNDASSCSNNEQAIREVVRKRNLLEIKNFIAWVPLCEFLGMRVPDAPAPELHDNITTGILAARPQRWALETAKKAGHYTGLSFTYTLTMASVTLISILAVFLGWQGLFKAAAASSQLLTLLLARSQIRDMTRLLSAGIAICTFVCGFLVGYSVALMRVPKTAEVASPLRNDHRRHTNGYKRKKQDRGKKSETGENMRPERPTLAEWNGVQENIRRDDAEMREEGRATLEEWKNGKHVTFHVTHKRTEAGQDLFSGPRKVLSVTEETV